MLERYFCRGPHSYNLYLGVLVQGNWLLPDIQPGIIHTDPRSVVGCGGIAVDVDRFMRPLCRVVVGGSVCEMPLWVC